MTPYKKGEGVSAATNLAPEPPLVNTNRYEAYRVRKLDGSVHRAVVSPRGSAAWFFDGLDNGPPDMYTLPQSAGETGPAELKGLTGPFVSGTDSVEEDTPPTPQEIAWLKRFDGDATPEERTACEEAEEVWDQKTQADMQKSVAEWKSRPLRQKFEEAWRECGVAVQDLAVLVPDPRLKRESLDFTLKALVRNTDRFGKAAWETLAMQERAQAELDKLKDGNLVPEEFAASIRRIEGHLAWEARRQEGRATKPNGWQASSPPGTRHSGWLKGRPA